jgi:hypothetical protein
MAVAIPSGFFAWFRAHTSIEIGLLVSDFTLSFATVGAVTIASILGVHRLVVPVTRLSVSAFIAGVLLVAYVIAPLAFNYPLSTNLARSWWSIGFELSVVLSSLIAYLAASRLWPTCRLTPALS